MKRGPFLKGWEAMCMPKALRQIERVNRRRMQLIRQAEAHQVQAQRLIDAANALGAKAEADLRAFVRTLPPEAQALAESMPELHRFFAEDTDGC